MYKVFVNERLLLLSKKKVNTSERHVHFSEKKAILKLIEDLNSGILSQGVILFDLKEEPLTKMREYFKIVQAAGGVVTNEHDELLFIFRNGKWDLPKGKLEKNEGPRFAAVREVQEETRLPQVRCGKLLNVTYHMYKIKSKYHFKVTYWYEMTTVFKGKLKGQEEEGIDFVRWLNANQTKIALRNTYKNIYKLFTLIHEPKD
tara:strand:+ start:45528 stop:46133 length:606 start_codon:yes stop_codon:yes gene_type:complete